MQERNIKVYTSRSNSEYPCIILQGRWLADLGFSAGDHLSIQCETNQIYIKIKEKSKDTRRK